MSSEVQLVLCKQGSPGPVGPPGSAGPSGEKVDYLGFFCCLFFCLFFTIDLTHNYSGCKCSLNEV